MSKHSYTAQTTACGRDDLFLLFTWFWAKIWDSADVMTFFLLSTTFSEELFFALCEWNVNVAGLRTRTRWTRSFLPNSNLNSKKYFFWTRTWTRIKLFEFIRKIFKLLKRNKRSLRNIVCCTSSHNPCKLKLWFYQKKSCMSFICSCHWDL